jgi:uncharacterized protein (DUF2062 family)
MATDPVRARRRQVARAVKLGKRVGYLLWLASTVLVVVGLATDLRHTVIVAATVCLVAGGVLLGPAIVLGYAVNAAERDDTARGR